MVHLHQDIALERKFYCVRTCVQAFLFHLHKSKFSTHINHFKEVIYTVYSIEAGTFLVDIIYT